jgi:ABC-type branched-subunit amino acid transport system substrate-binding protein
MTVVVAVALAGLATVAGAQSEGDAPTATEVGVTDKEIHIAVIADVDNAAAPGLFQGSVDGVRGVAKYLNKNGGLAGRKVVVDFIDSKLSPDEARNAMVKACEEDFAMVGTSAVFLTSVEPQANCVDKAGAVTGLPDIPFVTTEIVQQCSPITFPIAPPQIICSTKDEHPQTYQASVGRGFYYDKKYGDDLHGVYIFGNDSKSARNASFSSGLGQVRQVCCESDRDFDISALATQAEYTPVATELKSNDGNYAQCTGPSSCTLKLRKEAKIQGVTDVKVWDCGTQCYDPDLIEQGGADVEGQYADVLYLPFLDAKDRKANKMAANFVKYTGKDNAGKLGAVYAWAAGIALRDAVNTIVDQSGNNGLTRAALLDALGNIHEFDADGMFGKIDLGGRKVTPCHVLTQIKDGKFVRVTPTKPGTFDCASKNVIETQLDLVGQ